MFREKVGFEIDLKEERVGFRTVFDRVMQFIRNLGSRARETAEAMLFPVATLHLGDTGPLSKKYSRHLLRTGSQSLYSVLTVYCTRSHAAR